MKVMRLLVCGGRKFQGDDFLFSSLDRAVHRIQPDEFILIQGGAPGADELAKTWALARGFHVAEVPALWDSLGKTAGPRRNSAMILLQPTHCVAFPGNRGTADMVAKCKEAGIPVWQPLIET